MMINSGIPIPNIDLPPLLRFLIDDFRLVIINYQSL
jgi:hypothetical protein